MGFSAIEARDDAWSRKWHDTVCQRQHNPPPNILEGVPLIKAAELKTQTIKDLYALAKKYGLSGAYSMRKDQLVRALVKAAKTRSTTRSRGQRNGKLAGNGKLARNGKLTAKRDKAVARSTNEKSPAQREATVHAAHKPAESASKAKGRSSRNSRRIQRARAQRQKLKDLSHASAENGRKQTTKLSKCDRMLAKEPGKDRIVLLVRDAYWLQACWDITPNSVQRARAAMAEHWHTSEPVLRLIELEAGATTSASERVAREIPVHGGVKNWYIDVQDSPRSFRVELGYRADGSRFHTIAQQHGHHATPGE